MEIQATRLIKRDTYRSADITGLAARCDWFVCRRELLILRGGDPKVIFLSNFHGDQGFPYFYECVLPHIRTPFVLVIASEDYTFPTGSGDARHTLFEAVQPQIASLLANPLVIHIFVENLDTPHTKMSPLPLGLLPDSTLRPTEGPIDLGVRDPRSFCCHRVRPWDRKQWDDRIHVSGFCKGPWASFTRHEESLPPHEFEAALRNHRFVICVHGGGLDPSPRVWEALMCGSIPIVKHSTLDAAYGQLPVAWIDDWTPDCITQEGLDQWFEELRSFYEDPVKRAEVVRRLGMDYWWDQITAKLGRAKT